MDLPLEAERLRLDVLAVKLSATLSGADLPHVLIKGPTTSVWLYDPPRAYRDVDLLVPSSSAGRACEVLVDAGLARRDAGGLGEVAPHSVILHSTEGFEIDLHVSLPTVPMDGDVVWNVLREHVHPLDLGVGTVPVLDEPARCLVLALHALNNLPSGGQAVEDLRRAWNACSAATWATAETLARGVHALDLFVAGVDLVRPADPPTAPRSIRAGLYAAGAPSAAFGLERLASARVRDLPGLLWREAVPSREFFYYANPGLPHTRRSLVAAHLRRWRSLLAGLPGAIRAWRAARERRIPPE